jgi:predicted nuclease of predicted toxin-antitoxin system
VKLLLDEHYPPVIAEQLRRRGFDAVAVTEYGLDNTETLRCVPDDALLRRASAEGRALVTENVRDLVQIHRRFLSRGETHAGIILISERTYSRRRHAVGRLILALAVFMEAHETLANEIAWL